MEFKLFCNLDSKPWNINLLVLPFRCHVIPIKCKHYYSLHCTDCNNVQSSKQERWYRQHKIFLPLCWEQTSYKDKSTVLANQWNECWKKLYDHLSRALVYVNFKWRDKICFDIKWRFQHHTWDHVLTDIVLTLRLLNSLIQRLQSNYQP